MTGTPEVPGALARVTVSRNDGRDARHRQIYARIDDAATYTLLYGEAFTMEIAPGAHRLRANNTLFWKTLPFSVEAGEHLEFVLINSAARGTMGFLTLFGAAPLMLTIERRAAVDSQAVKSTA